MTSGIRPAPGRRAATAVLVFCVLLAGVSAPAGGVSAAVASGGADATSPTTTNGAASLSVAVERDSETVRFRASVDAADAAEDVRLDSAFGLLTVSESDGFRKVDGSYRLREGREQGTLVAAIDLSNSRQTPLGKIGQNGPFQAGEGWAFAPSPRFHLSWREDGRILDQRFGPGAAADEANVSVGKRFVFIGAHRVHESGDVRLILPERARFAVGVDRALSLADQSYGVVGSDPDGPVTAFVLPRAVRAGGAASSTDLWVRADAGKRTVAHEFGHTALALRTTDRTRWLGEASAEYVAYRVAGPEDTVGVLTARVTQPDAVLADRETWGGASVAYRKGAAVIAHLDERIRRATDGERSVSTVLAALSASKRIDSERLHAAVTAASNEATATWLQEHAGSSAGLDDAAGSSASTGTPGAEQRFSGTNDGLDGIPLAELSGLLTALGAFVVIGWVLLRGCYRLLSRFRTGSAV
ncbi:hypothetical protein [Halolamina salifodinae]|uniref:Uncharacterized protein n=1 Tax=Halolamina salifodinae TaxID=1202767 RepID=A0A8T4H3I3_9EURY|nr:hypothetical protein [Halolamina salifodinae]MBP1987748.1 hypothetical protein [Halolamina salifodinae]